MELITRNVAISQDLKPLCILQVASSSPPLIYAPRSFPSTRVAYLTGTYPLNVLLMVYLSHELLWENQGNAIFFNFLSIIYSGGLSTLVNFIEVILFVINDTGLEISTFEISVRFNLVYSRQENHSFFM